MYVHMHSNREILLHMHACTHTYIHAYIHTCMHTCACMCVWLLSNKREVCAWTTDILRTRTSSVRVCYVYRSNASSSLLVWLSLLAHVLCLLLKFQQSFYNWLNYQQKGFWRPISLTVVWYKTRTPYFTAKKRYINTQRVCAKNRSQNVHHWETIESAEQSQTRGLHTRLGIRC